MKWILEGRTTIQNARGVGDVVHRAAPRLQGLEVVEQRRGRCCSRRGPSFRPQSPEPVLQEKLRGGNSYELFPQTSVARLHLEHWHGVVHEADQPINRSGRLRQLASGRPGTSPVFPEGSDHLSLIRAFIGRGVREADSKQVGISGLRREQGRLFFPTLSSSSGATRTRWTTEHSTPGESSASQLSVSLFWLQGVQDSEAIWMPAEAPVPLRQWAALE